MQQVADSFDEGRRESALLEERSSDVPRRTFSIKFSIA